MSDLNKEQKAALGRMMLEGFKKGDPSIIEGCLKRGADPDVAVQDEGSGAYRPVLHWAMQYYNEKGVQLLLDYGANMEVRDKDGETALFYAIRSAKPDSVEFIMKHGADPVAQNNASLVVLDVARGMRSDYDYYVQQRDRVIRALTGDYAKPPAAEGEKKEPKPPEAPVRGPADDPPGEIHLLKPFNVQPKKGGGHFNL